MTKIFTAAVLLVFLSYIGFSDLNVEWINEDTIVVTGYGSGGEGTVVTNWMGCCTNCTLITPEELTSGMDRIISKCSDIDSLSHDIDIVASAGLDNVLSKIDEIGTFQRFGNKPELMPGNDFTPYIPITNYFYTVDNTQTQLVRLHKPPRLEENPVLAGQWVSYNNAIYDYANSFVLPYLDSEVRGDYFLILDTNSQITQKVSSISSIAEQYRNLSSCPCGDSSGGGGGDGGGGCAWTQDQIDSLSNYLDHIDQDQHRRFEQLAIISNNVFNIDTQLDSYAKLVSGVLYNDATIVVDDGDNSWTNVYRRGYSDLYDYDKSNILQRIELLLFGIAGVSSTTNWGEVGDLESSVADVGSNITSARDSLSGAGGTVSDQLEGVSDHFNAMFEALNFFGSGTLLNFSLNDPFNVFGSYDFEVASEGVDDLGDFRNLCRTCFQVIYWVGGIAFLLFFWYKVVSFVVVHVFSVIRFFNNLLT